MNIKFSEEMQPRELVEMLIIRGETSLLKGDFSGMESFAEAEELDPSNPLLFYRQGLSLFEYASEEGREKALLLACKKFKAATLLNPGYFEAWHLWGQSLCLLGKALKKHHYFIEAAERLKTASLLSDGQPNDVLSDLYWNLGSAQAHIATHSEEPLDLQLAIDSFQRAASLPEPLSSDLWQEFGESCIKLAHCINDTRLYVRAIHCFRHAISHTDDSCRGWLSLASAMQKLYDSTHDEDHFAQANECFSSAAQLQPQDGKIWTAWAQFLADSGRRNKDPKKLRSCVEKCQRAYHHNPEDRAIMGLWAEALSLLGELSDRLDLIYEAQNKLEEALSEEETPSLLFSYGVCLTSFGSYFHDTDAYYQAIERFQEGISIDRTLDRHWHAIAATYSTIGHLEADASSFEKSFRFFAKAIDLNPCSFYFFDYALALSRLGELTHQQHILEEAVIYFERALAMQKNALYLHPDWLFHYACTLDLLGDFHEEDTYYIRAIEVLSHVLMIDPDFPKVHHRLGLALSHFGELCHNLDHFCKALHHYRLAAKHDEENDQIILDWAITLINVSQHTHDPLEADQCYREAEYKLTQAAKLGNLQAYYHLSGLYSLLGQYEKAMAFIEKAESFASLPPLEELLEDDWLDGLRSTADFREFLSRLEKRTIS